MKVKFEYSRGFNDKVSEIVEFDDNTDESEIEESFQEWVWGFIGDKVYWEKL